MINDIGEILGVLQIIILVIGLGIIYGTFRTRLDYLETMLEKHNNFIERVYKLEGKVTALWEKVDDVYQGLKEKE